MYMIKEVVSKENEMYYSTVLNYRRSNYVGVEVFPRIFKIEGTVNDTEELWKYSLRGWSLVK